MRENTPTPHCLSKIQLKNHFNLFRHFSNVETVKITVSKWTQIPRYDLELTHSHRALDNPMKNKSYQELWELYKIKIFNKF